MCVALDTQSCFANLTPRPHTYSDIFNKGDFSPVLKLKKVSTLIRIVFEFESFETQKQWICSILYTACAV